MFVYYAYNVLYFSQDDSSDSSSQSYSSDNEDYVLYKDTNSMNSFLTDLYKKPPSRSSSQPASRAPSEPPSNNASPARYDTDPTDLFTVDRKGDRRTHTKSRDVSSPARETLTTVMEKMNDVFVESLESNVQSETAKNGLLHEKKKGSTEISLRPESDASPYSGHRSVTAVEKVTASKTPQKKGPSNEVSEEFIYYCLLLKQVK